MSSSITLANGTPFNMVCATTTNVSPSDWDNLLGLCPGSNGLVNYNIYNVNRDVGISDGETYVLNSLITRTDTGKELCILQVQLVGTAVFSDIAIGAKKDGGFDTSWFSGDAIQTVSWPQDGGTYTLNYSINGGAPITVGPANPDFVLTFKAS